MSRRWLLALLLLFTCRATVVSASGQTPAATPDAAGERSYENTCDGAQAWFDDLHDGTDAYVESGTSFSDDIEFFLDYFRNSNPPPILEAWTDAQVVLWANFSDFDGETDYMSMLEAIEDAEEDLEDLCEDHDFVEDFWG